MKLNAQSPYIRMQRGSVLVELAIVMPVVLFMFCYALAHEAAVRTDTIAMEIAYQTSNALRSNCSKQHDPQHCLEELIGEYNGVLTKLLGNDSAPKLTMSLYKLNSYAAPGTSGYDVLYSSSVPMLPEPIGMEEGVGEPELELPEDPPGIGVNNFNSHETIEAPPSTEGEVQVATRYAFGTIGNGASSQYVSGQEVDEFPFLLSDDRPVVAIVELTYTYTSVAPFFDWLFEGERRREFIA